jgi:hypothetical protein
MQFDPVALDFSEQCQMSLGRVTPFVEGQVNDLK